jgi:hypothetical protein
LALIDKLAARPSTIFRLAWLTFCLLVICLAGAPTLRVVTPYVLAGLGESPAGSRASVMAEASAAQPATAGPFTTWILPLISWTLVGVLLLKVLVI